MADLENQIKHLKQIVNAKDQTILNLQLQVLQLTEANRKVEDEQTKSDEVSASNSKSGK
jgi:hypothetical protein